MTPKLERSIREICSPIGLKGWCTPEKGLYIAQCLLDQHPDVAVEIGVYAGRSLLAAAFALQELKAGMIYGVDPWSVSCALEGMDPHDSDDMKHIDWWSHSSNLRSVQMRLADEIESRKLYDFCTLIQGRSELVVEAFAAGHPTGFARPIGFLHIDGNHTQKVSCRDVVLWVPLVKPGGIIVFDDTDWSSTVKAQEMLLELCDEVADRKTYKIYRKK